MSHETVLSALSALSKKRVYDTVPSEHAEHIHRETARTAIILQGSMIEHMLEAQLTGRLSGLNSTEKGKLFGIEGPLGTFANKTRIAKGLGIVDQDTAKQIDIVRAMRNAAAHCVDPISFNDAAIKNAVTQLAPEGMRAKISKLSEQKRRTYFELTCMSICKLLISGSHRQTDEERLKIVLTSALPDASPDTPVE